ncbi:DUF721 domain-containing protein [Methylomonas sp. SURF-2]|uniref:DUF721 domain-containing protein n=1 Tax=Methylomonas subterranea TaxID=2952225 RepID=A0ABT1TFD2_9GAMM|nr:DciA family protein [Methylomonas sp. SURF-2]MCQ8104173.1 DUF721 domain-containing protein [Methylomonas sp. SURF-2]
MNHSEKPLFKSVMDLNGKPLAMCLRKITEQAQLLNEVRHSLPADIATHATHCVLATTRLLVYTDSAVWASQIRFFAEEILKNLRATGRRVERVQVKLSLPPAPAASHRGCRLPSAATVDGLFGKLEENSADALDGALAKLGRTLRKRLRSKTA